MTRFLARLSSVRLSLALLLLLAALAAVGTLDLIPQRLPPEAYETRFGSLGRAVLWLGLDSFHTSLLYRLLFALFLANLTACCLSRGISGFREAFGSGSPAERRALAVEEGEAARRLAAAGFSVREGPGFSARRRAWAFLGFPLVHLSLIPLALGAFWGSAGGRVATQNVSVGRLTDRMYDWSVREDRAMPFALELRDLRFERYGTFTLRLRPLTESGLGEETEAELEKPFPVPGTAYSAVVERFDPETGDMAYRIESDGRRWGPYSRGAEEGAPVRLRPQAYSGSLGDLKRVEARVRLFPASGGAPREAVIAVNEPATEGEFRIFLTGWGKDELGQDYAGFQATSDPGETLVWISSLVFTLGLFLMLFVSGAWVEAREGHLVGRASRDRRAFADLLRRVASAEGGERP